MDTQLKLQRINQIIESREYLQNKDTILNFLKNRELKFYFLNKLPKKFDDLQEIKFLLEEIVKDERLFNLFKILEGSISGENNQFIISFVQKHYQELEGRFGDNMFQEESLRVVQKIIGQYPDTVDSVLALVRQILTLRGNKYKEFESKRDHNEEKQLISKILEKVFAIYQEQRENSKVKEIITLIDKHFNLVGDEGNFSFYTPNNIFGILKKYIDENFENRFQEIVNLIVEQYSQERKRFINRHKRGSDYDGWEWIGGGISQSGDQFSVSDRHFVSYILQPTLEKYHERAKDKAWKFIIDDCITRTKEEVSKNRPDFLNRSALGILLKEYESGLHKQEAFEILSDFVKMRKGILFKADLIFQALKVLKISDKDKWALIEVSLDVYNRRPINIFVEQITTDLAVKGYQKAASVLQEWAKDPEYIKQQGGLGKFNIIGNISKLLSEESTIDDGIKILKDYLSSDAFKNDLDRFDTFQVGRLIARAIQNKPEEGLSILPDIYRDPVLTINQQIVLTSSIRDIEDSKVEMLKKIYREFLLPALEGLGKDIEKIEKKFSYKHARENIVEFANKLAKAKEVDKTLEIIRIFINDSDPCTPGKIDPDDPKGEFDYHKKIINSEDTNIITTVRSWCAWVLTNCAVLEGRAYIEEIINLTEKLIQDKNYYVQLMSCHPLSQLARNRLAVMPENKEELFFNKNKEKALKMAKRVENIAFYLLEEFSKLKPKPRDVLMNALLKVFDRMKSLNQKDTLRFIQAVAECGEETISEAAPLFIFFAEFRKDSFQDWKWKLPGLFDDLKAFDDAEFKKILEKVMLKTSKTRSAFAWHFWKLVKESVPDKADIKNVVKYNEAFEIAMRYFDIVIGVYDHPTFEHIYRFVQDNVNQRFKQCYKLWEKCLKKERPVIIKLAKESKVYEASWWPFNYNDEILMIVKQKSGDEEFLNSLEFLLDYPKEANIGDISKIVEILQTLSGGYNQRIEKIFDKLIDRNPAFYDTKEAWKKAKKTNQTKKSKS